MQAATESPMALENRPDACTWNPLTASQRVATISPLFRQVKIRTSRRRDATPLDVVERVTAHQFDSRRAHSMVPWGTLR
jgi:hypothetical protein